ncbi:MAG: hypothetical protein WBQ25_11635 [Nitrososphaeraceae archaeon]
MTVDQKNNIVYASPLQWPISSNTVYMINGNTFKPMATVNFKINPPNAGTGG